MKYVTSFERFQTGEFPMVCVRSGQTATKMVPVQALWSRTWPWFLFPLSITAFVLADWLPKSAHPWGLLPFAEGQVRDVTATYDKRVGVIVKGAHPEFVAATRRAQGKATS